MNAKYAAALAKANAASAEFAKAQSDYRSRKIGDNEFLAARKVYDASTKEFDDSYSLEAESDDHSNDDLNLPYTY